MVEEPKVQEVFQKVKHQVDVIIADDEDDKAREAEKSAHKNNPCFFFPQSYFHEWWQFCFFVVNLFAFFFLK